MSARANPPWAAQDATLRLLLETIGIRAADFGGNINIAGADPVVSSRHRLGGATACALAAQGAAVAAIWKERTGRGQDISVDVRRAAVPGLRTVYHLRQNGGAVETSTPPLYPHSGFFRTRDGRQFYILRHPAYTNHLLRVLELLQCQYAPADMARAVAQWRGLDIEEAFAERKLVGVLCRPRAEWLQHPQGQWLATRPPVEIEKIGDSTPVPLPSGARPLSGLRVLDFSHVLAGPVTARTLAEQGADVLRITAPHQYDPLSCCIDTGPGKRNANLDLTLEADAARARELAAGADVFVQSWRPNSLARRGLAPEALAQQHPGLVYVSVSAYGSGGPWAERGGYEPVGQAACGLAIDEASADAPRLVATHTLNDYLSAYLAAAGTLGALLRRAREGGSYHVKVSLTRTSMWVQELGRLPEALWPADGLPMQPAPEHLLELASPFGRVRLPAPLTQYSETPAAWDRGPQPFGAEPAAWSQDR